MIAISNYFPPKVNEKIRAKEVRVIDENGKNLGILPTYKAIRLARERGLDLIEVAPNADPPVCRIMDRGKYMYERKKKEKEMRRKQKAQEMKEVTIKSHIDRSGLDIKEKTIRRLLEEGNKVRVTVRLLGRAHFDPSHIKREIEELLERLGDVAKVEFPPKVEGRIMYTILSPIKK